MSRTLAPAVALGLMTLVYATEAVAQCSPAAVVAGGNTILTAVTAGSGREVRATLSTTTACVVSGVFMKGPQVLGSAEVELYNPTIVFNVGIDSVFSSDADRLMVVFDCLGQAPKLNFVTACPESSVRQAIRRIRQPPDPEIKLKEDLQLKEDLFATTSQLLSQRATLQLVRAYLTGWRQGAARANMANPMAYGDFLASMDEVTKNLPPAKRSVFDSLGDVLSGAIASGANAITGGLFGMFSSLTESVVADAFDWGKAVNDGNPFFANKELLERGPVVVAKVRTMLRAFKADFELICRSAEVLEIASAKVDDAVRRHDLLLKAIQRQVKSKTPLDTAESTRLAIDQYFAGKVSSQSMSAIQALTVQSQVITDDYVEAISKSKFFVAEVRNSLARNPFDAVLRELREVPSASGLGDRDFREVSATLTKIRSRWQDRADSLRVQMQGNGVPEVIR